MNDKEPPPPWVLLALVGGMGMIAQLGVSLALGMARDKGKLAGFLMLSLVFSVCTTILLAELTNWDDYVCAAIGTLVGAAPALWTLYAGVRMVSKKYGVDILDLTNPKPPDTAKKDGGTDAH